MKSGASLLVLLSTATLAVAQQVSPSQTVPTFKSRTELVTVPVVVLKRQNPFRQLLWVGTPDEHVTGLTKDAFEIEEDGKLQPIASFEEITSPISKLDPVTPQPGTFTNAVKADGAVTMVVVLLDLLHTPYCYRDNAKKKLLDYLQNDFHGDRPIMLAVLDNRGLRILHDFTTDPQALAKITRQLKDKYVSDPILYDRLETDQQIENREFERLHNALLGDATGGGMCTQPRGFGFAQLQPLASALSVVRGMKSLIWITGEPPLPDPMTSTDPSGDTRILEQYEQTLKLFSSAGMAVYPIDAVLATGTPTVVSPLSSAPFFYEMNLHPELPSARFSFPSRDFSYHSDREIHAAQLFMDISHKTGGDYCLLRKDPDLCMRKAVDYNSRYYLLTYYTHSAEKSNWRKINVKVRGEGLSVRARKGYLSSGAGQDPEEKRKQDMVNASITPIEYRGLPLKVWWTASSETPAIHVAGNSSSDPKLKPRQIRSFVIGIAPDVLTIDAADRNHLQLDFVIAPLDKDGIVLGGVSQQIDLHPNAKHLEQLRNKGFAYSNAVELPAHTVKVRFIVRDDLSERIGTVSVPIEAQ